MPTHSPLARTRRLSRGLVAGSLLAAVGATGALAGPVLAADQAGGQASTGLSTRQSSTVVGAGSATTSSHATSSGS